jgi:hypothetical protein
MDEIPTTKAMMIMIHSTQGLAKKPSPSKGKLVKNIGTAAQCIAQSVEAVMPILSSLMAFNRRDHAAKIIQMQHYCI